MRKFVFVLITGIGLGCAAPSFASPPDDLCRQIDAFEAAPLALGKDQKELRRSIIFSWDGPWLAGGYWACAHKDTSGETLCAYLMQNSSHEFRAGLPKRILKCANASFPDHGEVDWSNQAASIVLTGKVETRKLRLDIDLAHKPPSDWDAVRLSVIPKSPSRDDKDPPELGLLRPAVGSGKDGG